MKISDRRVSFGNPNAVVFRQVVGDDSHEPESTTVWAINYEGKLNDTSVERDDTLLEEGYIIITPMSIDENNSHLKKVFQEEIDHIPTFSLDKE